jgi:hypothetical protein
VNLEADLLAKYTERLLAAGSAPLNSDPMSAAWLVSQGYGGMSKR